jgi:hypothetical protein
MYLIMLHVRDHFIVHAGGVVRENQCIAISGASGMGKSTLVAHLAADGMGFLSDELLPIKRHSGIVEPFPASIGIRPGPGEDLLTDKASTPFSCYDDHKQLIDVEALTGRPAAEPTPLHAMVFLSSNPTHEVATPKKLIDRVKVRVLEPNETFAKAVSDWPDIALLEEGEEFKMPWYILRVGQAESFLTELTERLETLGLSLAGLTYEDLDPPDYSETPKLVRIPQAAGVIELIKKIPASCKNALIEFEFGGKMTAMTQEIASLVKDVSFYKLSPGRLDLMIESVKGLS